MTCFDVVVFVVCSSRGTVGGTGAVVTSCLRRSVGMNIVLFRTGVLQVFRFILSLGSRSSRSIRGPGRFLLLDFVVVGYMSLRVVVVFCCCCRCCCSLPCKCRPTHSRVTHSLRRGLRCSASFCPPSPLPLAPLVCNKTDGCHIGTESWVMCTSPVT